MAELGLQLNKTVVLANSIISDSTSSGCNTKTVEFARKTLSRCDAVIVRDHQSFEYVKAKMPEIDCGHIPDSLFTWYPIIEKSTSAVPGNGDFILPFPETKENLGKLDFTKPYICLGGSAAAPKNWEKSIEFFTRLLSKLQELGYNVYLTECCGGDSFLQSVAAKTGVGLIPVKTSVFMGGAILANARVFISGRYHPSILAALGGTPCIFLGSVANKMLSLQKVLGYENPREFPLYPTDQEIEEMLELGRTYLHQGKELRNKIKEVARQCCEEVLQLPEILCNKVASSTSHVTRN